MERKIARDVSEDPYTMAKDIVNYMKTARLNESTKTVTRCLHLAGL